MTNEQEFQKTYELYKQGIIDLSSVDGSTLLRIDRKLSEELEEKVRIVEVLEKILYDDSIDPDKKQRMAAKLMTTMSELGYLD